MQALQLAELSSDALLVVHGSRVMGANPAARALFARFGRTRALEGANLDELWEESPAADGIAKYCFMASTGAGAGAGTCADPAGRHSNVAGRAWSFRRAGYSRGRNP